MTWLISKLKSVSTFLTTNADYLEKLDTDTRAKINTETRKAFWLGVIVTVAIEIIAFVVM